jgi:hypothetical protein
MTKYQRIVLFCGISAILIMIAFPPFQLITASKTINLGYGFILSPPNKWDYRFSPPQPVYGSVNGIVLLVQFVGVLIMTGLAYLLTAKKKVT